MENDTILDVTLLDPRVKHPTIFKTFDNLSEGESFVIHNDHNPKPLYYQLLGQKGNIFTWEYLEEGPEWWKVKIRKRILGESTESLGALVTEDLRRVAVFNKYSLDFACDGKKTLVQACEEQHINASKVERELQELEKEVKPRQLPYVDWDLDFLSDFIINVHHLYVRKNLPALLACANKVMEVHAQQHPELVQINEQIIVVGKDMMAHMEKEELRLFPLIKTLVNRSKETAAEKPIGSKEFQNFITMHEAEHASVGNEMAQIRKITNNYSLPQDACASYSLLYRMLREFEEDLQMHIHLENNLLFPKAIALENKCLK